jgi:hypothetical protein
MLDGLTFWVDRAYMRSTKPASQAGKKEMVDTTDDFDGWTDGFGLGKGSKQLLKPRR